MTNQAAPDLRVEVVQASTGPRLWGWAIYRGIGETPIDCSQSMFPTSEVARRVGMRIKDAIPAPRPIPFSGRQ